MTSSRPPSCAAPAIRSGWCADLGGSWEEVPSNVIDYAARDRRWAQGNLQHLGLLPMRGLHWLSRLHLVTGVLSYASSPIWLIVLTLSSIVVCMDAMQGFQYFSAGLLHAVSELAGVTGDARSSRC